MDRHAQNPCSKNVLKFQVLYIASSKEKALTTHSGGAHDGSRLISLKVDITEDQYWIILIM